MYLVLGVAYGMFTHLAFYYLGYRNGAAK